MPTDNLRTRIAAAISGVDDWRGVTDPEILADALIRELNISGLWSGNRLVGMVAKWDESRPSDDDLLAKEESIYRELEDEDA